MHKYANLNGSLLRQLISSTSPGFLGLDLTFNLICIQFWIDYNPTHFPGWQLTNVRCNDRNVRNQINGNEIDGLLTCSRRWMISGFNYNSARLTRSIKIFFFFLFRIHSKLSGNKVNLIVINWYYYRCWIAKQSKGIESGQLHFYLLGVLIRWFIFSHFNLPVILLAVISINSLLIENLIKLRVNYSFFHIYVFSEIDQLLKMIICSKSFVFSRLYHLEVFFVNFYTTRYFEM